MSYPIRLLSRQCNPFTTEILAYVNGGPQKIIVLSDLDEHMAFTAGNSFYEKGVDNVFIVSGGALKSAVLPAFQHWLMLGTSQNKHYTIYFFRMACVVAGKLQSRPEACTTCMLALV